MLPAPRRLAGVACIALLAACAVPGRHTAPAPAPAPAAGSPSPTALKLALNQALRTRDRDSVAAVFADDATFGSPGVSEPSGAAGVAAYLLQAEQGIAIEGFDFTPERLPQVCANGMEFEHGRISIRQYRTSTGEGVENSLGRYAITWRIVEGRRSIARMSLKPDETLGPLSRTVCPPPQLADSRVYRTGLTFVVLPLAAGLVENDVQQAFESRGWGADPSTIQCEYYCVPARPSRNTIVPSWGMIEAEYRLSESAAVLATGWRQNARAWGATQTADEYHRVDLMYGGTSILVAPEFQRSYFGVAAGPTLTYNHWASDEESFFRNEFEPSRRNVNRKSDHTSLTVGLAVQAKVAILVLPQVRFQALVQQRFSPAVAAPGVTPLDGATVRGGGTLFGLGIGYIR